jgi:cytochrome P450
MRFVPPYPIPHRTRSSLLRRFFLGWNSWIHMLFDKSYTMKMGEIHVPRMSVYIANDLPEIKRILSDPTRAFPKHRFLRDMLAPLIGESLFAANGDEWARQRTMIDPAFSHAALKIAFPFMAAATEGLITRLRGTDLSQPVAIDRFMTHVAADIIYRSLFSQPLSADDARLIHDAFARYQRHAQSAAMLHLYRLPAFGARRRAERAAAEIRQVFAPIVHARFAPFGESPPGASPDMLASILAARDPDTGAAFSVSDVMDQVSTIFLAGHETAASSMGWALYLIAESPELQDRLVAEVEAAFANGVNHAAMARLPTTRNVFREALRLYPPLGFLVREAGCPIIMRDKLIKKGSMLVVSPWLLQRNANHWDNPHAFDPDRFDCPAGKIATRNAWLPFGKGPRVCIGAGFAQQEALLILTGVVRAFRLSPVAGDKPEPVSRLTLRARRGIRLSLKPRD